MQIIGDIFNALFLGPVINLLVLILRILQSINLPGALGFSIIILTILVRILVWPFMSKQLKSAQIMAKLKPELDSLKKTHEGDKQALSKAQMELYKQHGVNPAGGCLPTLIQFPVLIALYQSIFALFNNNQQGLDHINNLLYIPSWHLTSPPDPNFLGFNLTHKPSEFSQVGYLVLLVPLLTALLTFIQSKMMSPQPIKEYPSDSPKEKKEKESSEDAMSAVQSQMIYMMPIMVGYFAFQFPVALAFYWNTLTLVGIFQQYLISGWGGLGSLLKKAQVYVKIPH